MAETSQSLDKPTRLPLRNLIRSYVRLTKPWVLSLLLLTTLASMMIAAGGLPPVITMVGTLVGGALTAAGASAINSFFDADIDPLMSRTRQRPVPQSQITPRSALGFGLWLTAGGLVVLSATSNMLAAFWALMGSVVYVFVYTWWLKRSTPMNIVIGGAAGALPPLVGWAAVTGETSVLAVYLFMVVLFWTPPHTWALTLMVQKDYSKANVPMLNVVYGEAETYRQIMIYLVQLIVVTLLPVAFGLLGWVYLAGAVALSGVFVVVAVRMWRLRTHAAARVVYKYSQSYLALLFVMMVIDRWGM